MALRRFFSLCDSLGEITAVNLTTELNRLYECLSHAVVGRSAFLCRGRELDDLCRGELTKSLFDAIDGLPGANILGGYSVELDDWSQIAFR